jgi:hypothetical protein
MQELVRVELDQGHKAGRESTAECLCRLGRTRWGKGMSADRLADLPCLEVDQAAVAAGGGSEPAQIDGWSKMTCPSAGTYSLKARVADLCN